MCVSGVRVCERVWAGKLVQGTKLRAFFVPALPLVNVSQALQGSSGREREREAGRGSECATEREVGETADTGTERRQKRRETVLQT